MLRKQILQLKYNLNGTTSKFQSSPLYMKRGLPQRAVIGPVLSLLLTNDLSNYTNSLFQMVIYADNTVLTLTNKNKKQLEEETLTIFNLVKQSYIRNDLLLNENKTLQMSYSTRGNERERLHTVKV